MTKSVSTRGPFSIEGLKIHVNLTIACTKLKSNVMFMYNIGSFSIDDGNCSENVRLKMNSRFFNLCRVYSNLLRMASVGELPWS